MYLKQGKKKGVKTSDRLDLSNYKHLPEILWGAKSLVTECAACSHALSARSQVLPLRGEVIGRITDPSLSIFF